MYDERDDAVEAEDLEWTRGGGTTRRLWPDETEMVDVGRDEAIDMRFVISERVSSGDVLLEVDSKELVRENPERVLSSEVVRDIWLRL